MKICQYSLLYFGSSSVSGQEERVGRHKSIVLGVSRGVVLLVPLPPSPSTLESVPGVAPMFGLRKRKGLAARRYLHPPTTILTFNLPPVVPLPPSSASEPCQSARAPLGH